MTETIPDDIPDNSPAEALSKANVLIEALPWLKRFRGEIVVIKFGGNAMVSEELSRSFAEDIVFLRLAGVLPVVVHGGGPQISARLGELGIESEFRGGYRVTTAEAMVVVREVLRERINASIVAAIEAHGQTAVGMSGDESRLFSGRRRGVVVDGEQVDLGHVGDVVVAVDPASVVDALALGTIPVVSSIAPDADHPGDLLNVNADAAAAALAASLGAAKLVILTDVAGLYSDWPNRESLVSSITTDALRELVPSLESGMIPKMSACLEAVDAGVQKAAIIDGRIPHSILLEVFTSEGIGTEVIPAEES